MLYLDNKKVKQVRVPIKITPPFTAHPSIRHFLKLARGKEQTEYIKVITNFQEEFELGEITSQKNLVKVIETTKIKEGYQLKVAMSPPQDEKRKIFTDYLTINIKDHPKDSLKVRCSGRITSKKKKPPLKK